MSEPCFTGDMGVLERLLAGRGFRLGRGTCEREGFDPLPTVVIDRPDTPEWLGVWDVVEPESEVPAEVAGEAQAAFYLAGQAIAKWELEKDFFAKED